MIEDKMYFVGFSDFYTRRYIIRNNYRVLSSYNRKMYKYYIYSRRYMKERLCDMVWEFLNVTDIDYEKQLLIGLEKENNKYIV